MYAQKKPRRGGVFDPAGEYQLFSTAWCSILFSQWTSSVMPARISRIAQVLPIASQSGAMIVLSTSLANRKLRPVEMPVVR